MWIRTSLATNVKKAKISTRMDSSVNITGIVFIDIFMVLIIWNVLEWKILCCHYFAKSLFPSQGEGDNCPKVYNANQQDIDKDGKKQFGSLTPCHLCFFFIQWQKGCKRVDAHPTLTIRIIWIQKLSNWFSVIWKFQVVECTMCRQGWPLRWWPRWGWHP